MNHFHTQAVRTPDPLGIPTRVTASVFFTSRIHPAMLRRRGDFSAALHSQVSADSYAQLDEVKSMRRESAPNRLFATLVLLAVLAGGLMIRGAIDVVVALVHWL